MTLIPMTLNNRLSGVSGQVRGHFQARCPVIWPSTCPDTPDTPSHGALGKGTRMRNIQRQRANCGRNQLDQTRISDPRMERLTKGRARPRRRHRRSMPAPPPALSTTKPKHCDPASNQCNIRGWEPVL
jgi:hypothetical protein